MGLSVDVVGAAEVSGALNGAKKSPPECGGLFEKTYRRDYLIISNQFLTLVPLGSFSR